MMKKNQMNVLLKLHSNNAMQSNKEHIVWTSSNQTKKISSKKPDCIAKQQKSNNKRIMKSSLFASFVWFQNSLLFLLYSVHYFFFAVEYDKWDVLWKFASDIEGIL